MSKKLRFIWIDDNPSRKAQWQNLKNTLKIGGGFVNVRNKNLTETLDKLLKKSEPDLVIIDHKLEDVSSGEFKTGSTAAEVIRETWSECPIVCVTGVELD